MGDGESLPRGSRLALLRLVPAVSRPLTAAVVVATLISGLLPPAFGIASGALAGSLPGAIRDGMSSPEGHRLNTALVVATVLFVLIQLSNPIRETLGDVLMRRLDEHVTVRTMRAVTTPRGVAHLEDADVLDRVAQAQGALTGTTPGAAAYYLAQMWTSRLGALVQLAILARFRWWLAVLLLGGHVVSFRWRQWHWGEVTAVVFDRTNRFRQSNYLRDLAVEPDAAKETRVFSLADWLVERYHTTFIDTMGDVWRTRHTGGIVAVAVTAGLLVLEGAALVLIADAGLRGAIGLGGVVVFSQAVIAASNLGQFTEADIYVEEGAAALDRLGELEDAIPSAAADLRGEREAHGMPRRAIEFENVSFRYPGRTTDVFSGLDLRIEAGQSLAIVGDNGAGKTTLVKLLTRLYDPTSGRITVDGVDLREIDPRSWQHRVAALFQDFVRYHVSAYDNVAFGNLQRGDDAAAVHEAGRRAGAATVVDGLTDGWDTVLSRQFTGGTDLSGGEWQRMALARALFAVASGAGVLVLDEPTASLDVRGEAQVYERFLELTRGITTIVISHRFSTVRRADRIVVLEHGQVVEDGSHDQLVAAGGRYARMYELQASRFRESGPGDA